VLPLVLLQRAGRWAARITSTSDRQDAVLLVTGATAAYAAIAFLVAQGASLGGATVPPLLAMLWAGFVAAIGLTAGVVDGAGLGAELLARFPQWLRRAGWTALVAGTGLAASVAVVALAAVVARWSTEVSLARAVSSGAGDTAGLVLVSLAYLPNLLVWALAYVVGPGFGIGVSGSVTAWSSGGALLPGIPLLGAVPPDAPAAAPLLLLVPVLCGIAASVMLRRRHELHLVDEVVALLGGAAVLGLVTIGLCLLSGGSLGSGLLSALGPPALLTGLATFGFVAAGAVLWSLLVRVTPTIWVSGDH